MIEREIESYQHTFVLINSKFVENFQILLPLIPAERHLGTASGTVARGGSITAMGPTNLNDACQHSSIYHQNEVNLEKGKSVPSIQMIRSCP